MSRQNVELIKEQQLREIEEYLQKVVEKSIACGISLDELIEMLTIFYKGE